MGLNLIRTLLSAIIYVGVGWGAYKLGYLSVSLYETIKFKLRVRRDKKGEQNRKSGDKQ